MIRLLVVCLLLLSPDAAWAITGRDVAQPVALAAAQIGGFYSTQASSDFTSEQSRATSNRRQRPATSAAAQRLQFTADNHDQLLLDMARRGGTYLEAMSSLLGCGGSEKRTWVETVNKGLPSFIASPTAESRALIRLLERLAVASGCKPAIPS